LVAKKSDLFGGIKPPRNVIYLVVDSRHGNYIIGGCHVFLAQCRFCRSSISLGGQTAKKMILGG
jgi:hypothetical protein